MSLMPTSLNEQRTVTTVALSAVLLVLGGVLLGLAVGAVSAYVIDVGLTHLQPGP